MSSNADLIVFMRAIAANDEQEAARLLTANPPLATAQLTKPAKGAPTDEFFLAECSAHIYVGHTALHVAASAYTTTFARVLVAAGADVQASNRRGATPLHAAVGGAPDSPTWNPQRQTEVINFLIESGADIDAAATGGVTPLQRAVRNRCSEAVQVLLRAGADPLRRNDKGSTAIDLAQWTTGRGGTGKPEAKAEQQRIIALLTTRNR